MAQEVELKLILAPQDVDCFKQHEVLVRSSQAPDQFELLNQYFDTPSQQLTQAGVALRLRRQDDCYIQTLKSKGSQIAGLHQRTELEWQLDRAVLDLSLIPQDFWPQHIDSREIESLFSTDFVRERWLINRRSVVGGEALIEVVLDQGQVTAGSHSDQICEVELELKQGDTADLFALALELGQDIPLVPSDITKAERGYRLVNRTSGAWVDLPSIHIDDTTEQAFHAVMAFELECLQREWEVFHFSQNWKHLYSFRNTLGNIRTHFLLFKDILPEEGLAPALQCINWIEERMNPILNWWPACFALSRQAHSQPQSASEQLQQAKAWQALDKLEELECQPRFGRCLLELSEWLHLRQWANHYDQEGFARASQPVGKAMLEPLRQQWEELRLFECGGNVSLWLERQPMIQGLNHVCQTLENILGVEMVQMRHELTRLEENLVELSAMDVIKKLGDWIQGLPLEEKQSINSWARGQTVIMRDLNLLAQKLMRTI